LVPNPIIQPVGGVEMEGVEKFQKVGSKACACVAIAIAQKLKFSMNFLIIYFAILKA
jgi:hypothetical protein